MDVPSLPFEMKQIQLGNTAFEGENNCYVLGVEDGATTTLVDTGIATPDTREQLRDGLAAHGLSFADVEQMVLTHWHGDHTGLAGEIQRESGAVVRIHEADAPLVGRDPAAREAMADRQRRLVARWGMPEDAQSELFSFLEAGESAAGEYVDATPFVAGDRFDVGSVELEAVHLPGHTAGLSGFAFPGRDGTELFSGDALLPYYTPNVGGADTRVEAPLAKYLDTLAGVVERGYSRAWPGHRGTIVDPPGRAADIVVHHRARTERVLDVLAEHGPCDAWTVSAQLFGDLRSIHILHGPGEAYAHLEHLADAGLVEADDDGESVRYELVSRDGVDALFPDLPLGKDPDALPGH